MTSTLDLIAETIEQVLSGKLAARVNTTAARTEERRTVDQLNEVLSTLEKTRSNKQVYVEGLRETLSAHESAMSCLSAACRMSESVNYTTNVDSLCRLLVKILVEEFDVENCSILLMEANQEFLALRAAYGQRDRWPGSRGGPYNSNLRVPVGVGIAGRVCKTKRYEFLSDVSKDQEFRAIPTVVPIGSLLCIPLLYHDQVIGVLNLSHPSPGHISQIQKQELMFLSKVIGNLLTLCRCQSRLREFNAELERRIIDQTTKLEASEKRYRCLVENATDVVFTLDRQGSITFVNSKAQDLLGRDPDPLLGQHFGSLLGPEAAEKHAAKIDEWIAAERVDGEEVCVKRGDGKAITLALSMHTSFERGEMLHKQGLLRDVTEQKRLEEQLVQSEKLKALGELSSGVAHNFNNILGGILGKTELVLYRTTDPRMQRDLETIRKAAIDGAETVKRIQEFTRLRTDTSHFMQVDINEIVSDAINFTKVKWKDEAEAAGIAFRLTTSLGSLRPIAGQPSELREVFTNIILNALDAMPDGGTLDIATSTTPHHVEITFADSGSGIPEDLQERIFDPFFSTKVPAGQGLGLSVSYGTISRHRGTITVESSPSKGSTFKVTLPICSGRPTSQRNCPDSPNPGPTLSILVVDDEMIRETLKEILTLLGHNPAAAADGEQALALLAERHFDVTFTDLGMPGMNGWQVAEVLSKQWPDVRVVMMTGWGVQIEPDQKQAKGIRSILPKPFNLDQVRATLRESTSELAHQSGTNQPLESKTGDKEN